MSRQRYQLNITLVGTRPPIWRRLEVPAEVGLSQLHVVLQLAMGWLDAHLHQFESGGVVYGVADPELGLDVADERKIRLSQVLSKPKQRLTYLYDFGDDWEHHVVLEQIVEGEPEFNYPIVLGGERACPPEDVGGVPGFENFLAALHDPTHPDYDEIRAWWGGPYAAEEFDLDAVNEALLAAFVPPARRARRRTNARRRR